ncbi:MAG TPA: hypothetical protein VLH09_13520 [Bryobacteraceae bacterium]|nr:hypothetical protein [Bryobacteraceae bacterium]
MTALPGVAVAVLFFPLRKSFMQLRDETVARGAVRDALRTLGPPDAILSQQPDITQNGVVVRLVVTGEITSEKVQTADAATLTGYEPGVRK